MRIPSSVALVIVVAALFAPAAIPAAEQDVAWTRDHIESYFGPHNAFRITIESETGVVSVMEVPAGVFLSVVASEYETRGSGDAPGVPLLYRGDMTIRTRRHDEVREGESSSASALMAAAPLEISLRGVVVAVEILD